MNDKMILLVLRQLWRSMLRNELERLVKNTKSKVDDRIFAIADALLSD